MEQPRIITPPHGRPVVGQETPLPRPEQRWLRLPRNPALVHDARDYAVASMAEAGVQEPTLVGDVRLLVSEAITNAMRAAERYARERGRPWESYEYPVGLRVVCRPRWVHLLVTDPDPQVPEPEPRDLLDEEGGRGFTIIQQFAALSWFTPGTYGKTFHVVATRTTVTLTPDDVRQLRQRMIM
jgi:anti-sigma regulatory factor (Ser/Thr protein kinase)